MAQTDQQTRDAVDWLLREIPAQNMPILRKHLANLYSDRNPFPGDVRIRLEYGERRQLSVKNLIAEAVNRHGITEAQLTYRAYNDLILVAEPMPSQA